MRSSATISTTRRTSSATCFSSRVPRAHGGGGGRLRVRRRRARDLRQDAAPPSARVRRRAKSRTAPSRRIWEEIKREERGCVARAGVLDDVPVGLPALTRAVKLGKRAATVGFDWPDVTGVRAKVDEELAELDAALACGAPHSRRGKGGGAARRRCGRRGGRRSDVHGREFLPPSRPRSRGLRARRERAFRAAVRPRRGASARAGGDWSQHDAAALERFWRRREVGDALTADPRTRLRAPANPRRACVSAFRFDSAPRP